MLETISYTLAAIILYMVSDMLLQRLELNAGHRFEHRSVIFFFILSKTILGVGFRTVMSHLD